MFNSPRSQDSKRRGGQQGNRSRGETEAEAATGATPGPRTVKRVRERAEPAPSTIWQILSGNFAAFSFAVGLAALTLADDIGVRASELWISCAFLAVLALTCGLAHWDANRGRRTRTRRVEEEVLVDDA